jgi:TonB family protein
MVIHFNISRQGELTDIEVVTESGNRSFDLAGYRAVALASPLPPLPQSYRSDSLGVNLLIR